MNNFRRHAIIFLFVILLGTGIVISGCNGSGNESLSSVTAEKFVPQAEGPKIKFESLTHDFGEQESGAELSTTFKFKNLGSETLVIDKVKAS